jgi:hypothetical protein
LRHLLPFLPTNSRAYQRHGESTTSAQLG